MELSSSSLLPPCTSAPTIKSCPRSKESTRARFEDVAERCDGRFVTGLGEDTCGSCSRAMSATPLSVSSFRGIAAGRTSDTPWSAAISVLDGIILTIDNMCGGGLDGTRFLLLLPCNKYKPFSTTIVLFQRVRAGIDSHNTTMSKP